MKPIAVISTLAGLAIAGFFVASRAIGVNMSAVSSLAIIAFAIPGYYAVVHDGWRRGLAVIVALGIYALAVESSAIATGIPYGDFVYNDALGAKLLGLTPWSVAFAYPPILLLAYTVVVRRLAGEVSKPARITSLLVATAAVAMLCDIVLDPAAVRLGFWHWRTVGFFYGVPLINFAGWLASCFVGASLIRLIHGPKPLPVAAAGSGLAIVWFWAWVNLWLGQWLPAVFGLALFTIVWKRLKTDRLLQ